MPSRRTIKGVLHNFLGTFTSRYSDWDGYWVFGFLTENIEQIRTDLLRADAVRVDARPAVVAKRLAVLQFAEQLEKAGFPKSRLREACLEVTRLPGSRVGATNGHVCSGYDVRFAVQALTDLGKRYERALSVFIAPHNPAVELRSTRVG